MRNFQSTAFTLDKLDDELSAMALIQALSEDYNLFVSSLLLKDDLDKCKAFTLQGETHRHQGKPDQIYTGAYTKVQMSSLSKNRLKRRYTCWHHQRVMPNNYKYPRGSHNVRGK